MGILDLVPIVGKILDRVLPDKAASEAAKLKVLELAQTGELAKLQAETDLAKGQLEVNKVEAGSTNLFVSGWRPFVGWVCGLGLAYQFLIRPILGAILATTAHAVDFPTLEMGTLMTLLGGLLGFGAMRTTEKINGVASK